VQELQQQLQVEQGSEQELQEQLRREFDVMHPPHTCMFCVVLLHRDACDLPMAQNHILTVWALVYMQPAKDNFMAIRDLHKLCCNDMQSAVDSLALLPEAEFAQELRKALLLKSIAAVKETRGSTRGFLGVAHKCGVDKMADVRRNTVEPGCTEKNLEFVAYESDWPDDEHDQL